MPSSSWPHSAARSERTASALSAASARIRRLFRIRRCHSNVCVCAHAVPVYSLICVAQTHRLHLHSLLLLLTSAAYRALGPCHNIVEPRAAGSRKMCACTLCLEPWAVYEESLATKRRATLLLFGDSGAHIEWSLDQSALADLRIHSRIGPSGVHTHTQ